MNDPVTNQTLFQSIVDAIKIGDAKAANTAFSALPNKLRGTVEIRLMNHLKTAYEAKFGRPPTPAPSAPLRLESICGRLLRLPDSTGKRQSEGGRRLKGEIKRNHEDAPLVSIITVVYNNVDTIQTCIDSVMDQSYSNIEYIVVDGDSTDGTLDIIEAHDDAIDYFVSEPDGGIYDAMNKGLSLARGEYISFLNADDYYFRDAVAVSIKGLSQSGADFSFAGLHFADENDAAIVADEGRPWQEAMLVEGIMGGHETCFVHKSAYDLIGGYDETYQLAADYHWFTRAFFARLRAHQVKQNILVMRSDGKSFEPELERSENRRILQECFPYVQEPLSDLLYELKYYRNWQGNKVSDETLLRILSAALDHSVLFQKATLQAVYNRKTGIKCVQTPALDPEPGKLKIAIALTYMTGISGGAERIATEVANELSKRGHAVTFVSCHGLAGEPFYRLDPGVPFIDLAITPYKEKYFEIGQDFELRKEDWQDFYFDKLGFSPSEEDIEDWSLNAHLWRTKMYAGFLKSHDFDIVISHMPSTFPYTLLAAKRLPRPPKQIACLHNAPSYKFYSKDYPADNDTDRHMRLASLAYADKIAVLFDEFKDQMPEGLKSKCITLPNFIGDTFRESAPAQNTRDQKVIVSVGRLVRQKDHKTLIHAFRLLKDCYPDWSLHIYGDGPLKSEIEQLCIEHDLDPASILKGTRRDIEVAYETASIFAFPSLFEGFGLTALEAMAHGLPVVAFSDCEGVKNLVRSDVNGILVSRRDPAQSLANGLTALIEDETLRASLASGARKTASEFSIENHVNRLEQVFDQECAPTTSCLPAEEGDASHKTSSTCAILSTYIDGGAGIAAHRLQKGLQAHDVDALLFGFSQSERKSVLSAKLNPQRQALYDAGEETFRTPNVAPGNAYFSSSLAGLDSAQLEFLRLFDVINLHWIENLVTPQQIFEIASFGKPVVWTLHDMKPLTGGCHYTRSCRNFETGCHSCPQLDFHLKDYPSKVLQLKQAMFPENIVIVTPSKWLGECARNSLVFKNHRIEVIPNGIDLDEFKPTSKEAARKLLGLSPDKKLILFNCHDHSERRKGFPEFAETVELLASSRQDIELITLGHASSDLSDLKLPCSALGFISDPQRLALIYAAADVTVLPTLEDNLPNIILESIACGTPVVAFDSGGVSDGVLDGVSGYLADVGDCKHLAQQISKALNGEDLSTNCRAQAVEHFSNKLQAKRYLSLFRELSHSSMVFPSKPTDCSELTQTLQAYLHPNSSGRTK